MHVFCKFRLYRYCQLCSELFNLVFWGLLTFCCCSNQFANTTESFLLGINNLKNLIKVSLTRQGTKCIASSPLWLWSIGMHFNSCIWLIPEYWWRRSSKDAVHRFKFETLKSRIFHSLACSKVNSFFYVGKCLIKKKNMTSKEFWE